MGHEHRRGVGLGEDTRDVTAQLGPQRRVQRAERLVEEHDARADGQGPGERHPLLLAAGELMGVATSQAAEPDELEQLLGPGAVPSGDAEADVAHHRQVGEQGAFLGDVADASVLGPHRP